ncbi:hypothetical protein E4U61_002837 [Claviceps capensis]|nr:hypothetical protein E4U61_002837 [Claviceps capensis]
MAAYNDIATRTSVLTLDATGFSTKEVASLTGVPTRTVDYIFAKAVERGFNPQDRPLNIKDQIWWKMGQDQAGQRNRLWKSRKLYFRSLAHPTCKWAQKDEANKKAWVDEEDEG